jgi:nucleoside-diphosphate-sugar epimerase
MGNDTEWKATVLVLGAAGFIGRELVRQLLVSGYHVRAMIRGSSRVLDQLSNEQLAIVRGDLGNKADLTRAISGADFVFHLANAPAKTWDEQQSKNVEVTRLVGELCVVNKVERLIYTGTIDSYYAGSRARLITEKTPLDPDIAHRNYYARAKAAAERILVEMQKTRQLPLIIARPGIVIGSGGTPFHGAVGRFSNHGCEVWGDGKNKLPLVLVSDVAAALVKMITTVGIESDIFNLIDQPLLSAREYLAELQRSTGQKLDITYRPIWRLYLTDLFKWTIKIAVRHPDRVRVPSYFDWESRTQKAGFSCDHARNVLGWQPASDRQRIIDEGIRDAVQSWPAAVGKSDVIDEQKLG